MSALLLYVGTSKRVCGAVSCVANTIMQGERDPRSVISLVELNRTYDGTYVLRRVVLEIHISVEGREV
jgi:hypothetical protein